MYRVLGSRAVKGVGTQKLREIRNAGRFRVLLSVRKAGLEPRTAVSAVLSAAIETMHIFCYNLYFIFILLYIHY